MSRTNSSNEQLQGHLRLHLGTPQEQAPSNCHYTKTEEPRSMGEGQVGCPHREVKKPGPYPARLQPYSVYFHLDLRQKDLLWYSAYQVQFDGDYNFRNDS